MRRSRKFDQALDECLERVLIKGETIEECLESFPEHAEELALLLQTALATEKVAAIKPRPEFREKARLQFHLALQKLERQKNHPVLSWRWQPRWVTAVAIILALLLASGGTVAAASQSMPDEPLYPVKLAIERAQLGLTPSALGKAELYAELADRRVLEIVYSAGKSKPEQIERISGYLDAYLTRIADLAATQQATGSIPMLPDMPQAPSFREGNNKRRGAPPGDGHRARLRSTMMSHAINQPARLRALLETVPESARPALLRAIAISERGYAKALRSLDEQGQATE